jgi:hypothetical protein
MTFVKLRCCLVLLIAPLCAARPKSDTVALVNGNSITCEIRSLSRGVLVAKTDSLSTVSIRWEDVTRVQSDSTFEIVLSDGTTHVGVLTAETGGRLLLSNLAAVPLLNIVSITPIGSRFTRRFSGAFDIGYSFLKSNATTQLNSDGTLAYTTHRHLVEGQVSTNFVNREGTATTQRIEADLSLRETLSRGYFALGIGQFSRNDELNLIHRYLGGGGVGHYFVRTNRSIVSLSGGGAFSSERYAGGEQRSNGEALVDLNSQFFRLHSPKLDIGGEVRLWPNLTTAGRFRIDVQFKARIEVYKNLFVSFSFFDNYDRKNPTTSAPLNDYGVVMSVGYSFNR